MTPTPPVDPQPDYVPPKPPGRSDDQWPARIVRAEAMRLYPVEMFLDNADTTPELIAAVDARLADLGGRVYTEPTMVGADGNPAYVAATVAGAVTDVATAQPKTRNNMLFKKTARAAEHLPPTGAAREALREQMIAASEASGLVAEDGLRSVERTIDSAFSAADRSGPAQVPAPTGAHADEVRPRGTALPDVVAASADDGDRKFWDSRQSLSDIWDYGMACMVSPWGLLGTILIYVLDFIPYYVALPGIADDDSPGSLNQFLALVGASGANKGRTTRAARRYVGRTDVDIPPGSGEGMVKVFVRRPTSDELKTEPDDRTVVIHDMNGELFVYVRRNAVLNCAEVDSLAALKERSGSTLPSVLRQAFSAETLGNAYADESKRLLVLENEYRLTMIVGVQPERSGVLFDDASGGTPQRFLWMPATDRRISRHDRPFKPAPITLQRPTGLWPSTFGMCETAREEIEVAAEQRAQGVGDPLDGHALFVRAKVAAALTVLDGGRVAITDEDWRLAGMVMDVSARTRARCQDALARAAERATEARGRAEGMRASVAGEIVRERAIQRVAGVLARAAAAHGAMSTAALRKRLAGRDRALFEAALELAMQGGRLVDIDGQVQVP